MDHSDYKKHSKFQNSAIGKALETGIFGRAVEKYLQENPGFLEGTKSVFKIAEFGSADGCNSVPIYRQILTGKSVQEVLV